MPLGHSIDIVAEIKGHESHIQETFAAKDLFHIVHIAASQDTDHQIHGELVMPGRDRGMGGKYASCLNRLDVLMDECPPPGLFRLFIQKFQGEKARMPFVHVTPPDPFMSQCPQYPDTANPKDNLLTEPVMAVAAIKKMGNRSIPRRIFRKVCVQEIDRDLKASCPGHFVFPGTYPHSPSLDGHGSPLGHLF